MIPQEVLRRIRRIEITTKKKVTDVFAGDYKSVFKGRGIEFAEVRSYQWGDDVRTIDWNVTARMRRPFVKQFHEERELTVLVVVDASGSLAFGSRQRLKSEVAAEICALLALLAVYNNDKVGVLLFSDRVERYIRPQKGRWQVLRLIREVLYSQPQGKGTDLGAALEFLLRALKRRAIVFLISDFLAEDFERPFSLCARKHDLVPIVVSDVRERVLPPLGFIHLEDAETGEPLTLDLRSRGVRAAVSGAAEARRRRLSELFSQCQLDSVWLDTGEAYLDKLINFFRFRAKKAQR